MCIYASPVEGRLFRDRLFLSQLVLSGLVLEQLVLEQLVLSQPAEVAFFGNRHEKIGRQA
jgi:hypothetical protein